MMLKDMRFARAVIKTIEIIGCVWLFSRAADSLAVKLDLIGRPATQSSTYLNPTSGAAEASRAIDGNYDSNGFAGFCSHTDDPQDGTSWWRVDLGQLFRVQGVMIVNRGDCCEERLDNFVVGLSNSVANPVRGQYSLCGQYPGPTAIGSHLSLRCNPNTGSRRYVIVQQANNGDGHLSICEIEIYAIQTRNLNRWKRLSNQRLISVGATVLSIRSAMMCVGKCQETDDCYSVNYRQLEKKCEMNFMPSDNHMVVEKGWDYWVQMYDE